MPDLKKKLNLLLLNIVKSESDCVVIGQSYLLPAMHVNSNVFKNWWKVAGSELLKFYSYFSTEDLSESTNT